MRSSERELRRYRFMAFATGVLLVVACAALILKDVADVKHMEPGTGYLWVVHGWLFLVYVVVTFMLGLKLRWPILQYLLVMAAGTIPFMSFVAEHFVTRQVRRNEAASVTA